MFYVLCFIIYVLCFMFYNLYKIYVLIYYKYIKYIAKMSTYKKYSKLLLKKTKINNKSKKCKKHIKSKKCKNTQKINGGGILSSIGSAIVQVPKEKNYTVRAPGSGMLRMLNPSKLDLITKPTLESQELIKIIYNYHLSNQIDIINNDPNKILSSENLYKEPYVLINSMGKYLLVMYRIINKKNIPTPKLLLHWLVGYVNRIPFKIFNYIAPTTKAGKIHNFVFKLYKLPNNNDNNFIKINNINKKKAYIEFYNYVKSQNLLPINTYNVKVKGDANQGINLFNMLGKQKTKLGKY